MPELRFDGIRIWASITVPKTVKLDLRKHGAELTKLERDADMILVDPDHHVAFPEKSFSYRWVEECMKTGQKIDEEQYRVSTIRANAPAPTASPAAAPSSYYATHHLANGGRRTRTLFTNEDDQILIRWVREKAKHATNAAGGISGNVIYKELEQEHPHHSYHSWRDRWIKKLQFTANLDEAPLAEAPPPPSVPSRPAAPAPAPKPAAPRRSDVARPPAPSPEPAPAPARRSIGSSREVPSEGDNICFLSKRDRSIFKGMYEQAIHSKHASLYDFFRQLNNKHPSIPIEEWEARYMRLREWYSKIDTFDQEPPAPPPAAEAHEEPVDEVEADQEEEEEEDNDVDFDASALLDEVTVQDAEQKQFYDDVEIYNEVNDKYIPKGVIIDGRLIDTYSLWTTVREVSPDRTDRDWAKIVAALHFDSTKNSTVERDLAHWYMDNLSVLEEALVGGESLLLDEDESMLMGHELGETEIEVTEEAEEALEEAPEEAPEVTGAPHQLSSTAKRQLAEAFPDTSQPSMSEEESESEAENAKKRRVSPPNVEPETQDFDYAPETQMAERLKRATPDVEVTPAQQLHLESRIIEAVPLTLPPKKNSGPLSSTQRSRRSLPAFLGRRREQLSSQNSPSPSQST